MMPQDFDCRLTLKASMASRCLLKSVTLSFPEGFTGGDLLRNLGPLTGPEMSGSLCLGCSGILGCGFGCGPGHGLGCGLGCGPGRGLGCGLGRGLGVGSWFVCTGLTVVPVQ